MALDTEFTDQARTEWELHKACGDESPSVRKGNHRGSEMMMLSRRRDTVLVGKEDMENSWSTMRLGKSMRSQNSVSFSGFRPRGRGMSEPETRGTETGQAASRDTVSSSQLRALEGLDEEGEST